MRVNWAKLRSQIPARVRIKRRYYEIVWVDSFPDGVTLGETRFAPYQIALKTGQSDRETVLTYRHEVYHAISEEEEIGLTEKQVQGLEKSLLYTLKPGNIFNNGKK